MTRACIANHFFIVEIKWAKAVSAFLNKNVSKFWGKLGINHKLLNLTVFLLLSSCQPQEQDAPFKDRANILEQDFEEFLIDEESEIFEIDKLKKLMESYSVNHKGSVNRSMEFYPPAFLKRISPWFASPLSMEILRVGKRPFFHLKVIPEPVLENIIALTLPRFPNSGFGVLHNSFWKQLGKLQDRGIIVGFLTSRKHKSIIGAYYPSQKIIGVDIFAGIKTLDHEYRHHLQYNWIGQFQDQTPVILAEECVKSASIYFGELEASGGQVRGWVGIFDSLPLPNLFQMVQNQKSRVATDLPQPQMVKVNLTYPKRVFKRQDWHDCPDNLRTELGSFHTELSHSIESISTSIDHFTGLIYDYKSFQVPTEGCPSMISAQAPWECRVVKEFAKTTENKLGLIAAEINRKLEEHVEIRNFLTSQFFESLEDTILGDLCRHAAGVRYLAHCNVN